MIASLIIALHLLGVISVQSAISSLYIAGALLIVAELGIISFGLIAFNGVIAIYAAYALQVGSDLIFGVPVGIPTLFGIAFIEFFVIGLVVFVHLWLRKQKAITGKQAMLGAEVTIIEWKDTNGFVNFEGEIWKAKSKDKMELNKDEKVTIESINKLELIITA